MKTEQQLRVYFAAEAEQAPLATGLADGAVGKVRRRRRNIAAVGVASVAVLASVGVAGLGGFAGPSAPPVAAPSPVVPSVQIPPGMAGKPLPDGASSALCRVLYSPAEVAKRAFSFDGTVTAVGPATTDRAGGQEIVDLVGVTFEVHQWFRGGGGKTVTVDLIAPDSPFKDVESGYEFTYGLGTRLLVSGDPRWGGDALDNPLAWWGCGGFTRYYGPATADAWERAVD